MRVAKQIRLYFAYHTGQHSKMPVNRVPSFNTAAAKGLEQEAVHVKHAMLYMAVYMLTITAVFKLELLFTCSC